MTSPLISTVVLNWNRAHLLEQTLYSYIQTVTCPHELWVIDNASSDHSRQVMEEFKNTHPDTHLVFLTDNDGGEAYNEVIPKLSGEFIYLSENDQIHQPGWCEQVQHAFASYPWLGQLSLHAPVPTDAEAWVSKKVTPRFKNGSLLYELEGNVTTSCIIRRTLFDHGLRLRNIQNPQSHIKLPDDAQLSKDVKNMKFWVAYSDHYYVRNAGHETQEMEQNPEYYKENYNSKHWMQKGELEKRIQLQQRLSHITRQSLLFPDQPVLAELSETTTNGIPSRFWSMFDSRTPNVETIEFIYSLIRLTKPSSALETGGWLGHATLAISRALSANGMGKLTSIEENEQTYVHLVERMNNHQLDNVEIRHDKSERFETDERYDFVLFNSEYEDPEEEFFHIMPFLNDGATLVFLGSHEDTHPIDSLPKTLEGMQLLKGQHHTSPRGLYVGTYQTQAAPASRRIIFSFSPGRSGTFFLTSLLKGLPDLVALHEPEPKYQWQTIPMQNDPNLPARFISEQKLPWINALPGSTYFEASHYMHRGFLESWLDNNIVPDVIIIERDLRKVATSWYCLNVDFVNNPGYVIRHMLHPKDVRQSFLPLSNWEALNNYQLCYWYALESRKRAEHYSELITSKGGHIFKTSLDKLTGQEDIEALLTWMGVTIDDTGMETIRQRAQHRVNDKNQFKDAKRLQELETMDFDMLEAAVHKQCNLEP